jgi:hypothetical protein
MLQIYEDVTQTMILKAIEAHSVVSIASDGTKHKVFIVKVSKEMRGVP